MSLDHTYSGINPSMLTSFMLSFSNIQGGVSVKSDQVHVCVLSCFNVCPSMHERITCYVDGAGEVNSNNARKPDGCIS